MNILCIEKLVKRFGGVAAVNHCSFSVAANSITALIGPNGAGKTTMFDLLTGLLEPDSGDILFEGEKINAMATCHRSRLGIARTFQAVRIFPELTAEENVMLALPEFDHRLRRVLFHSRRKERALREKARGLLDAVNLAEHARAKAGSLSYGQKKLLEIARAIATDAKLFLFDEPAAGVNRTLLHTIENIIIDLKKQGKTVMIVEHDMGFVMKLSDRVIVMDYGKEIAEGTPQEIQKNPKVLEAYLGVTS